MKSSRHESALIDEGLGEQKILRLDCNTESWRSSLRLVIQSDAVFIVSFNEHGPWNLREGHGRMMTKGNTVGKECYCGRRAFSVKGNDKG